MRTIDRSRRRIRQSFILIERLESRSMMAGDVGLPFGVPVPNGPFDTRTLPPNAAQPPTLGDGSHGFTPSIVAHPMAPAEEANQTPVIPDRRGSVIESVSPRDDADGWLPTAIPIPKNTPGSNQAGGTESGLLATLGDAVSDTVDYVGRSARSLAFGDWTDEEPTALSIGAGVGLGIIGADLPLDIRDLGHTLSHPEWSYDWGKRLVINGVGVLPIVGVIKYSKYLDDVGDLAKRADDIASGRRLAGQFDSGVYPTPPGHGSGWEWAPGSGEGRTSWRWWDPQGGEWRWHPPDSWHPNGHWDHNPWRTWNDQWQNVDGPIGGIVQATP